MVRGLFFFKTNVYMCNKTFYYLLFYYNTGTCVVGVYQICLRLCCIPVKYRDTWPLAFTITLKYYYYYKV